MVWEVGLAGIGVGFGRGVFGKRAVCLKTGLGKWIWQVLVLSSVVKSLNSSPTDKTLLGEWCWQVLVLCSLPCR